MNTAVQNVIRILRWRMDSSGNQIPAERTYITRDELDALETALAPIPYEVTPQGRAFLGGSSR